MDVSKIVIDSRKAFSGCIFIPIRGEKFDGHQFIGDAVENGATTVVIKKSFKSAGRVKKNCAGVEFIEVEDTTKELGNIAKRHLESLRPKCKVVVITGSVGKTTTKDITASLLAHFGNVVCAKESYNNEIGVPLTIFEAHENTDYLVLEVGANHVGEIDYLVDICNPDVAVLLKIGVAHFGEFKGAENIRREKVRIFKNLGPQGSQISGCERQKTRSVAIFNRDDANSDYIRTHIPAGVDFLEFGIDDVQNFELDENGKLSFVLVDAEFSGKTVETDLVGEHNVYNALAALRITQAFGFRGDETLQALKTARVVAEHRMQIKRRGSVVIIDDSYNANPDSMLAGLIAAAKIATRNGAKLIAILGDMLELGDKTDEEHATIASVALNKLEVWRLIGIGSAWARYQKQLGDKYTDKFMHFPDTTEKHRKKVLSTCILNENVVLLSKGSCTLKLWELGDYIIKHLECVREKEST